MILRNKENIAINKDEVFRYLGYKGQKPTADIQEKIEKCILDAVNASELRSVYQRFPLRFSDEEGLLFIGEESEISVLSINLAKNLRDCSEVFIFGATIGVGIDRLIARASISNMLQAAIYQAVGAAYIEAYCDKINEEINEIARLENKVTRPRYSPGYGDFGIENQSLLFSLLDLTKHTGITLTEGLLMMPSKSVTALIGVKSQTADCEKDSFHDCAACNLKDCQFRKP